MLLELLDTCFWTCSLYAYLSVVLQHALYHSGNTFWSKKEKPSPFCTVSILVVK